MPKEITLNPGYPSELTTTPGAIQVPDLWHLAQALKDNGKDFFLRDVKILHLEASTGILDTWHLAHALKRYIQDQEDRRPLEVCKYCLMGDLGDYPDLGAAYVLVIPDECRSQRHPEIYDLKTAPAHAVLARAHNVVSSGPCYCAENEHHDGPCMGPECHCHFDR
jgi:hypothetical protein